MYRLFDEYIGREFAVDYWSDEGISQAALILVKFGDSDWKILVESCLSKPITWGIRCAEALGDIEEPKALKVLLQLLKSASSDVRVAALDSIRSLVTMGMDISAHVQEICEVITQIRAYGSVDHVVDVVLTSLEKKLSHVG